MLKDFSKLETFLTVVKEKSFSQASAKLGISQPAVTQQIKHIEEYLDVKIIERKKNGVRLTKEGEKLLIIAQKLERSIASAEKGLLKIINKEVTFTIAASFAIGNYILPYSINGIKSHIKNDVFIKVEVSESAVQDLLDKNVDLAIIESQVFRDNIIYREWMEDEMVLFSNSEIPRYIRKDDLYKFRWVCRDWNSHTRRLITERFEEIGVDCANFDILGEVTSATAVKQMILKSPKNDERQAVAILSKYVVADEVKAGVLHEAKVRNCKLRRKFYIAYHKDRKNDPFVQNVVNFLMNRKNILT